MEMIEEIDWDGNTVAIHPIKHLKERMFPHKASLVIPRTKEGKFIISLRAKDKHPYPGTWMCAIGGKVSYEESYEEAAKREMLEESNHDAEVEYVTSFKHKEGYQAFFHVFTTTTSVEVSSLTPDPREVQYFKEVTKEELVKEVEENPDSFAPTFLVALENFLRDLKN